MQHSDDHQITLYFSDSFCGNSQSVGVYATPAWRSFYDSYINNLGIKHKCWGSCGKC